MYVSVGEVAASEWEREMELVNMHWHASRTMFFLLHRPIQVLIMSFPC